METTKYIISFGAFFTLLALESLFPLFSGWKRRGLHIARNVGIVVINNIVYFVLLSSVTVFVFKFSEQHHLGLFYRFQLPAPVRLLGVIILFDFWMYIWHRITHQFFLVWRFHRMHHSDLNMDASTALRFHPVEIVMSTILRWGIFLILGITAFDLLLYEMIMLPIIFFHHSNFFLPEYADKILRNIIVTPWMHWVHHSHIFEETNSNYGTIFSWWDRLFGTFRLRRDPEKIHYGLDKITMPYWQSITGMLKTPFVNKFDK